MGKMITCQANELGDKIANEFGHPMDLDGNLHDGFTLGIRGKIMYWYFIWHPESGNASIYTSGKPMKRAYIYNDQIITIHFK